MHPDTLNSDYLEQLNPPLLHLDSSYTSVILSAIRLDLELLELSPLDPDTLITFQRQSNLGAGASAQKGFSRLHSIIDKIIIERSLIFITITNVRYYHLLF